MLDLDGVLVRYCLYERFLMHDPCFHLRHSILHASVQTLDVLNPKRLVIQFLLQHGARIACFEEGLLELVSLADDLERFFSVLVLQLLVMLDSLDLDFVFVVSVTQFFRQLLLNQGSLLSFNLVNLEIIAEHLLDFIELRL